MDNETKLRDSSFSGLSGSLPSPWVVERIYTVAYRVFLANYEDNSDDAQVKRREYEAIGKSDQRTDPLYTRIQRNHSNAHETIQVRFELILIDCF